MKTKIIVYLVYVVETGEPIKNAHDANFRQKIAKFLKEHKLIEELAPSALKRVVVKHKVVGEE